LTTGLDTIAQPHGNIKLTITDSNVKTVNSRLTDLIRYIKVHDNVKSFCKRASSFFLKQIPERMLGKSLNGSAFTLAQRVTLQKKVRQV
jgi:hypothetical protein